MKLYRIDEYGRQSKLMKTNNFQKKSGMYAKAAGGEDIVYISDEAIEKYEREKKERFEMLREQNIRDILTRRLVYEMTKGIDESDMDEISLRFHENQDNEIIEKTADILLNKLFIISH